MAEIYRDAPTTSITLSTGTATSVKFVRNGEDIVAPSLSGNTALIPYSITRVDGDFDTVWNYTQGAPYTRIDRNTIVTPYFNAADLTAHDSDFSTLTTAQVIKLERLVRGVIDAYVGHNFGYEEGWVTTYGTGDSVLHSPKKVLTIASLVEGDDPIDQLGYNYRPINQGFDVELIGFGDYDNIKVPASEEHQLTVYRYTTGRFINNTPYTIYGTFGYHSVPYDVNLAALHLAEEFSCDENLWRDRYIKSIAGDGFDIEFRSDAFTGTGSVIADQLLGKYVANKLVII